MYSALPLHRPAQGVWTFFVCMVLVLCTACDDGEEPKPGIELIHQARDLFLPLEASTPIALNSAIELAAVNGEGVRQPIASATSDSLDVDVELRDGTWVVIRAVGLGSATVRIELAPEAEQADVFEVPITSLLPTRHVLSPPIATGQFEQAVTIAGGQLRLGLRRFDDVNPRIVGQGLAPIAISPPTAGEVVATPDYFHTEVAFAEAGFVSLQLPDEEPVPIEVLPPEVVVSLALEGPTLALSVDDSALLIVRASTAEERAVLGLSNGLQWTTTDACRVERSYDVPNSDDAYALFGVAPGECVVDVTWGELSAQHRVEVK